MFRSSRAAAHDDLDYGLALVTAPAVEPVDLAAAKAHLHIDGPEEEANLTRYILAAREWAETFTRRAFVTQTWDLFLDCLPRQDWHPLWVESGIKLPRPNLQSVTWFKYIDLNGVSQTFDAASYAVDTAHLPGRVTLAYQKLWPLHRQIANAINIRFVAGYGAAADAVPGVVKQAMLLRIGDFFRNREGGPDTKAAENLLWSVRADL